MWVLSVKEFWNFPCILTETAECIQSFPVSKEAFAFLSAPVEHWLEQTLDPQRDAHEVKWAPCHLVLLDLALQSENSEIYHFKDFFWSYEMFLPVCTFPSILFKVLQTTIYLSNNKMVDNVKIELHIVYWHRYSSYLYYIGSYTIWYFIYIT